MEEEQVTQSAKLARHPKFTLSGADLIIGLFLMVTVPHTAFILMRYESELWWPLGWLLAAAIDVGIAYGGVISSNNQAGKEARRWATMLFLGLSVGSYYLNVQHYLEYNAGLAAMGLGAFFPIGIMLLAKIKSRLVTSEKREIGLRELAEEILVLKAELRELTAQNRGRVFSLERRFYAVTG